MSKRRLNEDSYRRNPWFRSLCQAFLSQKNEDEMADFLRDIATLSELQAMSERLEVAKELSKGLSYRSISKRTGASTTTVSRVAWFVMNGPGGYRSYLNVPKDILRRMKEGIYGEPYSEGKIMSTKNARHHASSPREERPVSVLQKFLKK